MYKGIVDAIPSVYKKKEVKTSGLFFRIGKKTQIQFVAS